MTKQAIKIDYTGIDISKHTLEAAFDEKGKTTCYENTPKGVEKLIANLKQYAEPFVIIEPTGGYELLFEQACHAANINVILVLANRVRDFAKATGELAKTDRIDAQMLLRYGATFKLTAESIAMRKDPEFKALMKRREQLVKLITQEKQHLESCFDESVQVSIKKIIARLEAELKEIENKLADLVESDEALKEKSEYLRSIKGVGEVTVLQTLSSLPEIGLVSNKEIAALVGLAPYVRESGQYRGQARIYGGRMEIRNVLYMACLSAIRCNKSIRDFYNQLKSKGKPFKVAMVACMRKLLIMMNCVCREKRLWQEDNAC